MDIDNELSALYGAVSGACAITLLYEYSLQLLPESRVWKAANKKEMDGAYPDVKNKRRKRGQRWHWSERFGLTTLDKFLEAEIGHDHAYLYNLLLVYIWGTTEAKIDDIIVSFLVAKPKMLKKEPFKSLECKIGDVLNASPLERARTAIRLYRDAKRVSYHKGISRFSVLLDAVGLGGGVPEQVTRRFLEMSEIRHNLVHRMGIIDQKLATQCPWLKMPVGHKIHLSREYVQSCAAAIKFFVIEIDRRIQTLFGEAVPEHAEKLYQYHLSTFDPSRSPVPCPHVPAEADVKSKKRSSPKVAAK